MLSVAAPQVKTTVYRYSVPFVNRLNGSVLWKDVETTSDRYSDFVLAVRDTRFAHEMGAGWRVDFDGVVDHNDPF